MTAYESGYKLLFHCAPTIYGVKSANLFSLQNIDADEADTILRRYSALLRKRGLKARIMKSGGSCALFYVYNEKRISKRLSSPAVRDFLESYGYKNADSDLDRLQLRIASSKTFPHEIGVFLDYPLCDVKGFIENKGRNFKYSGCWKVYSDVAGSVRKFRRYDSCREDACAKLRAGMSVSEVLLSA